MEFYGSAQAAEQAGFRACKRCLPEDSAAVVGEHDREPVARMCAALERSSTAPTLDELGRVAGLSPHYAQRTFVKALGLTPKQYRNAIERQRIEAALGRSDSVTQAIHGAGLGSAARFYRSVAGDLGMQPARAQRGGQGASIRYGVGSSALGLVLVAVTNQGVCAVSLGDEREELVRALRRRFPRADVQPGGEELDDQVRQIAWFVEGRSQVALGLPLDVRGTAFQERVWRALRQIPAGTTRTYTELAQALGAPSAVRAVAHACGQNPLAVLVPCHRVLQKGGGLAGYRWGLERKRALLQRERPSVGAAAPRRDVKAERAPGGRKR